MGWSAARQQNEPVSVWQRETGQVEGFGVSWLRDLLVAKQLKLRASGSGVIRLPDLTAESVEVQLSGSASVRLAGQANELTMNMGGSGMLDASALQVRRAESAPPAGDGSA